ncbi:PDR/VanB family oxidoreductase [Streptosporangium sp. NPDC001559]|uniref:PDR/VanB family oxidoreductase n=1 Tax=Streptosporangium sp. NPDC001559 TaxID=3366187 RepID=UPI0036F1518A
MSLAIHPKVLATTYSDRVAKMVVAERTEPAEGIAGFVLADPGGGDLPRWTPGAHIDVVIGDVVRQYSLCGDPADRKGWRIAVLREAGGRGGSARIHDTLRAGTTVEVRGPRNHFMLEEAPSYVFVAGGIGITPIKAMVGEAEAAGADWRLYYGGRSMSTMAFTSELTATYGEKVTIVPEDVEGRLDLAGILSAPATGTLVYACGPEGLLAALEDVCAPFPKGTLRTERFAPRDALFSDDDKPFEVTAEQSGVTVTVEPGRTILHALDEAGVMVFSSCEEGICGTCETRVIAGTPDHRDSVLTDLDRERGDVMMICCSRAISDSLVLDI